MYMNLEHEKRITPLKEITQILKYYSYYLCTGVYCVTVIHTEPLPGVVEK